MERRKNKGDRIRGVAARLNDEEYKNLMAVPRDGITNKIVYLIGWYNKTTAGVVSEINNYNENDEIVSC